MFLVMWTAMMIAMMLPSVTPAMLLHRRVIQLRLERGVRGSGSDVLRLAGYFFRLGGVWCPRICARHDARISGDALDSNQRARPRGDRRRFGRRRSVPADAVEAGMSSPLPIAARLFHAPRDSADVRLVAIRRASRRVLCRVLLGVDGDSAGMSVPLMALVALVILLEKQWRHGQMLARVVGAASVAAGIFIALRATIRG